jgi:FkbM family methyltransferase
MAPRKIFLDVGGYRGEASRAALDPLFAFDRVYCFEPVRSCFDTIRSTLKDRRFTLYNAGLLDETGKRTVYHAGGVGGSAYDGVPELADEKAQESCDFIRASEFFAAEIGEGDLVWVKLNCEGAECAILDDLFETGHAAKLTEVLVDLDARKNPNISHRVSDTVRRLESNLFSCHYPEEVQYGMVNNFGAIRNWLVKTGAGRPFGLGRSLASIAYQARYVRDPAFNGYYKIRILRALGLRGPPDQNPVPPTRTKSRILTRA